MEVSSKILQANMFFNALKRVTSEMKTSLLKKSSYSAEKLQKSYDTVGLYYKMA